MKGIGMKKSELLCIFALLLCFVMSSSFAQDELPIVGIVKAGSVRPIDVAEQGIIDVLEAYGYEDGRNIEIRQVDAAGDVTQLPAIIELLIAEEVDIIMPLQAQTIAATVAITEELENPPAVIFSVVQDPYAQGLAEDACTKPAYLTGQSSGDNNVVIEDVMQHIRELDPDLHSIALVYNSNDAGATLNAGLFEAMGEKYDFTMMIEAVSSGEEVVPVLETLLVAGAESMLVIDVTAGAYLSELSELSVQAQVPLFAIDAGAVYLGTTLGVGTDFYQLGANAGRMAAAYLEGNLDLATTGISDEISILRAINLDVAVEQGLAIPNGFVDTLNYHIENGESTEAELGLPEMTRDEMREQDAAFIESLQCPREPEATEAA
jgi:putative tryptophan/tyrosine transport system substrate-binding protein